MTEDRESAIYATGYWKGVEYKRMRELTDEEIDNLIMDVVEKPTNEDLSDFARAILKKASERA
jgi:hypothetical protein